MLQWLPYAASVKPTHRSLCLRLGGVFAVAMLVVTSPSKGWAQSGTDIPALLRTPFEKLAQAARSKTRYTYFDLNHVQNFNDKGKKTADTTQLYEVTYIRELQYSRLVEINGKPLKGKQLAAEQKRYDDALQQKSALDDVERAKILHMWMTSYGIDLSLSSLSSQFRTTIAGRSLLDICDCLMIDAAPLPGAPSRKYRMWVDPAKQELLKMDSAMLADDGKKMKSTTYAVMWTYIEGVPLVSRSHIDAGLRMGKKKFIRVVVDHTYTQFRKFSVTSTVVPVGPERD